MRKDYFTSLRSDHPLFQNLKKNDPVWWQFVKRNLTPNEFYVDVRKDNSLNVYYNGGSLLKIEMLKDQLISTIHEKYLGGNGSAYTNYDPANLPKDADEIKQRIEKHYSNKSESGIKAKLIRNPDANYFDSEFAFPKIRIDLIKLENGKIVFVELKRIEDSRLLTDEYEDGEPEILTQMKAYHQFIEAHVDEITDYYKRLFVIKHDLGILPKTVTGMDNIDDHVLCKDVELYIEPYTRLNPKRIRRINAIKTILNKNGIIHNL